MHTSATTASSVPGQRAPERDEKSTSINETVSIRNRPATAPQTVPSNGQRRLTRRAKRIGALASLTTLLATSFVLGGTSAANAGYTGGGGQTVNSGVHCEWSSASMAVDVTTTQMFNYSAYAAGQYVRYRVFTRNTTNGIGPWVESVGWSRWLWVDADYNVGEVRMVVQRRLDSAVVQGRRGNRYQVAVQTDHWMGQSAVGTDYWPDYTGDYYGTRMYPSSSCQF